MYGILWNDGQEGKWDNHRDICEVMSGSEGSPIFSVVEKPLTEHFEEIKVKVWKMFNTFIEENGEDSWPRKQKKIARKQWRIN